jgi:hypothetical protein
VRQPRGPALRNLILRARFAQRSRGREQLTFAIG